MTHRLPWAACPPLLAAPIKGHFGTRRSTIDLPGIGHPPTAMIAQKLQPRQGRTSRLWQAKTKTGHAALSKFDATSL